MKPDRIFALAWALVLAFAVAPVAAQQPRPAAASAAEPPPPLGALAPANLAKPRPQAPFDLTGTWFIDQRNSENTWRFNPTGPFKLTPAAQTHYDAAKKAQAEGKVYHDDIGQCWPAGLPIIMTRVWPIAMIQMPTAIYMVSGFMNELRVIYLDGRPHPGRTIRHWLGDSRGRWEGDTLVVDTTNFSPKSNFRGSHENLHLIERFTRVSPTRLEYAFTVSDDTTWTRPWSAMIPLQRSNEPIYEYACHEGNLGLEGILTGARAEERAASGVAK